MNIEINSKMVNDTYTDKDDNSRKLMLDSNIQLDLAEAGKWAKILGVISLISIGLMVVFMLFMATLGGSTLSTAMGLGMYSGVSMVSMIIMYLLIISLYVYPMWQLFLFGKHAKKCIENSSQDDLLIAVNALKKMFKFLGILMLIFIGLYALIFLISFLIAGFAA